MDSNGTELVVVTGGEVAQFVPGSRDKRKSKVAEPPPVNHDQLRSYFNRLLKLHIEKQEAADAIKEVAAEAKGAGFSGKALLQMVKRHMETAEQRAERIAVQEEIDRMCVALGAYVDTPLGSAAMRAAAAE